MMDQPLEDRVYQLERRLAAVEAGRWQEPLMEMADHPWEWGTIAAPDRLCHLAENPVEGTYSMVLCEPQTKVVLLIPPLGDISILTVELRRFGQQVGVSREVWPLRNMNSIDWRNLICLLYNQALRLAADRAGLR
jgi:hypothetical protein